MTIDRPICCDCKHYHPEISTCDAFPVKIPDAVFLGNNNHMKPLRYQKNTIVFEPIAEPQSKSSNS
jgi:hypothetical protein